MLIRILNRRLMESTPGTDGSTSSPSSPATSAPSNEPSSGGAEAGFDFAALALDSGDGGEQATPPTPTVTVQPSAATPPGAAVGTPPAAALNQPAAATQPAAVTPSAVTPPTAAPTPAQPTPAQSPGQSTNQPSQAAPQAATQPTQNQPQTLTPEAVAQRFAQHREQFMPQLQQLYAIPEAEVEELRTAPETALPKLAAKLHYEVQLATFNALHQALPDLIAPILKHQEQVTRFTQEFKSMWPQLHEKPEYEAAAEQAIRVTRQMNPNMPIKDVLQRAGTLAMLTLGIPLPAPGAPAAPTAQPAAPTLPARQPPLARPPGVASASPAPLSNPGAPGDEGNIFEMMATEHLRGE